MFVEYLSYVCVCVYIYIYMCVCVCVCVCARARLRECADIYVLHCKALGLSTPFGTGC